MTDGTADGSTWIYDSLGRLTTAKNGAGQAVSYSYDLRGLPTGIIYPNNKSITRVYDKDGRLTSVKDWLKNTTSFKYDADGNLLDTTYPNGWTGAYQYDKNDRVTGIDYKKGNSGLLSFSYTRTNAGLLASEALNSGTPTTYSYDGVLRLVDVSNQVAYTYDDADRVIAMPAVVTLAYDDADQLSTADGGTFSYDRRANRISFAPNSGTTLTFTYDGANRLTGYEGTATCTYAYDGDGLRVSKTPTGGTTEAYVWDRRTRLPAILADGGSYYIYGPVGMPLEQVNGSGAAFFYHADQLGSIRMITDSKGATCRHIYIRCVRKHGFEHQPRAGIKPLRIRGSIFGCRIGASLPARPILRSIYSTVHIGGSTLFPNRSPLCLRQCQPAQSRGPDRPDRRLHGQRRPA